MKDTHTTSREYAEGKICEAFGIEAEHITMQIGKIPKFSGKDLLDAHEAGALSALSGQWRSVAEPPEIEGEFIVYIRRNNTMIFASFEDGYWFKMDGWRIHPSHWMPKPEPPKE